MSIPGRVDAAVKGLALWAGLGVAVLVIALAGLGFLIAGFFLWVASRQPHYLAAAITGGVLLAIAIVIAIAGKTFLARMKRRQPTLMSEIGGMAGIVGTVSRIAGLIIRKDPRKSLIIAVIVGAVAEYITSGDKKKN